ncbi:hypothetical protein kam1_1631 [Methylacidiphilum kamchatkense Kam1]|uniref:Uncharacterized protein n=1 Tax=Methylacidiphilum kamchatkense Kam1 TaxID=1202785 RepID=A0A516TNL7_9BACT|nr:hypothetical protein kam1_1631 [Methylacidiphilum kamchatkense Kam1]
MVPEHGYTQAECWEIFGQSIAAKTLKEASLELVKKFYLEIVGLNGGILLWTLSSPSLKCRQKR